MNRLEKYVGRIVRLNKESFNELMRNGKHRTGALENCFLVAAVSRKMRKLICYSANMRIIVYPTDIALI